ncbi:MAG TPA: twin-arginine translocase subunit TatC [Bryobacteraceae bacterium]|nr:twin-arginine translocase subunit TatC [Bryobacteraceae bacterium]
MPDDPQTTPATHPGSPEPADPYAYPDSDPHAGATAGPPPALTVPVSSAPPAPPTPPASTGDDEEDDDDDGMLRMSFLEHLEELRSRILKAVSGLGVAFLLSLTFSEPLWRIVQEPATSALRSLGYTDAGLVYTSPMEGFSIIWMKLPLLTAVFLASPWLLYQVWAFVAPGLYKRERRLAVPFILYSAGLFLLGGMFAYFIAFRFGLTFLLGIGRDVGVRPMVTISEYFDIFVNVMLGISLVFELPVLIFFLALLRITSARFLIANSRYAVLGIVILAAVITPTPDVFNLMIFSVPMVLLFFIGVFAAYLLELSREEKKFPWGVVLLIAGTTGVLIGGTVWLAVARFGYKLVNYWPFVIK